jgi:Zn-finger nucleic acid-binding protein
MNVVEAICCTGCGRELGLELLGSPSDRRCPRCTSTLTALRGEHGYLLDCGHCGGQFVEHALFRDLLDQRAKLGQWALRQPLRQRLGIGDVRYVACPHCQELMNRHNFGGTSGVVIDVCHRHGSWFDAGELAGVLAFVETGGAANPPRETHSDFRPTTGQGGLSRSESNLVDGAEVVVDGFSVVEVVADVGGDLFSFVADLISD